MTEAPGSTNILPREPTTIPRQEIIIAAQEQTNIQQTQDQTSVQQHEEINIQQHEETNIPTESTTTTPQQGDAIVPTKQENASQPNNIPATNTSSTSTSTGDDRTKYIFAVNECGHIVDPYTGYHRCIYNPLKGKEYYLNKKSNPSDPSIATFGDVIQITTYRDDLLKQNFTNIDIEVLYRNPISSYKERILPENKQNVQTQMMYKLGELYSNAYYNGDAEDDMKNYALVPYTLAERGYNTHTPYIAFISGVQILKPTSSTNTTGTPSPQQQKLDHLNPYIPYQITLMCLELRERNRDDNNTAANNAQSQPTTPPQYELLVSEIECFCFAIKYAIIPPVGSLCTVLTTERNPGDRHSEKVFAGYLPICDLMPLLKQHFNIPSKGYLYLNDSFVESNQFKMFLEQKVEIRDMLYTMLNMQKETSQTASEYDYALYQTREQASNDSVQIQPTMPKKFNAQNPFALYNKLVKIANSFPSYLLNQSTTNNNATTAQPLESIITPSPIAKDGVVFKTYPKRQMMQLDCEAKDYFTPLQFDELYKAKTPTDIIKLLWYTDYYKMDEEQQAQELQKFNQVEFCYLNRFDYYTNLWWNITEQFHYSSCSLPFGVPEVKPGNLIVIFPHPIMLGQECHKVIKIGNMSQFSHSDGMRMLTMLNKHKELVKQPLIPVFCDLPFAPHTVQQVLDGSQRIETQESIKARKEYADKPREQSDTTDEEPEPQYYEFNQVDLIEKHTPNNTIFKSEYIKLCSSKGERVAFQPPPKELQNQSNIDIDDNNNNRNIIAQDQVLASQAQQEPTTMPHVLSSRTVMLAIPIAIEFKDTDLNDEHYCITFLTPTTHAAAIDDTSIQNLDITNSLQFKRLTICTYKRHTLPKIGTLGLFVLSWKKYGSTFRKVSCDSWLPISYKPLDAVDVIDCDKSQTFVDTVHHYKQPLYHLIRFHRQNVERYLHAQQQQQELTAGETSIGQQQGNTNNNTANIVDNKKETPLDFNFKSPFDDEGIIVSDHVDANVIPSDYTTKWDAHAIKSFVYNPKDAIPPSTIDPVLSAISTEIDLSRIIQSEDEDIDKVEREQQSDKIDDGVGAPSTQDNNNITSNTYQSNEEQNNMVDFPADVNDDNDNFVKDIKISPERAYNEPINGDCDPEKTNDNRENDNEAPSKGEDDSTPNGLLDGSDVEDTPVTQSCKTTNSVGNIADVDDNDIMMQFEDDDHGPDAAETPENNATQGDDTINAPQPPKLGGTNNATPIQSVIQQQEEEEDDEIEIALIKPNGNDESGSCITSQVSKTDPNLMTISGSSKEETKEPTIVGPIADRRAFLEHLIGQKALTFHVEIKTPLFRMQPRETHINIDSFVSELGSGQFGTAFCVLDSNTNENYVVKVISPRCDPESNITKSDVLTLWREFDVAHRLRTSTNVAMSNDVCQFYGEYPHGWHRDEKIVEMVRRFQQEHVRYKRNNLTNEKTWSTDKQAQKLSDEDINILDNFFKNYTDFTSTLTKPQHYTGYTCLIMEYIPQPKSLADKMDKIASEPNVDEWVDPKYYFTRDEIYDITSCAITACLHLAQHKIVHRDIKPDNMRIYRYDNISNNNQEFALAATSPYIRSVYIKLVDFGCGQPCDEDNKLTIVDDTMTIVENQTNNVKINLKASTTVGSLVMIPPEGLAMDMSWLSSFDAFSVGITILGFIFGYVPGCYKMLQTEKELILKELKQRRQNMSCDHYLEEYTQYYNGLKNGKYKSHIKSQTHNRLKIIDKWILKLLRSFLARNPYRRSGIFGNL